MYKYLTIYIGQPVENAVHLNTCSSLRMASVCSRNM